jgi:hypothetical protein
MSTQPLPQILEVLQPRPDFDNLKAKYDNLPLNTKKIIDQETPRMIREVEESGIPNERKQNYLQTHLAEVLEEMAGAKERNERYFAATEREAERRRTSKTRGNKSVV